MQDILVVDAVEPLGQVADAVERQRSAEPDDAAVPLDALARKPAAELIVADTGAEYGARQARCKVDKCRFPVLAAGR